MDVFVVTVHRIISLLFISSQPETQHLKIYLIDNHTLNSPQQEEN